MSRIAACNAWIAFVLVFGGAARAETTAPPTSYATAQAEPGPPEVPGENAQATPEQEGQPPPIPPFVDQPPVPAQGGGYCFEGAHPVDSRVVPGVTWDATQGRHIHPYPPFDLRLFNLQNGCYYFIGDPTDFGYAGDTYSYYGAHPILATYGGGWCFMVGPHRHFWRPWSPLFVTVGPWFYWEGPYDPFFWTYWPYYHYYYRAHYPHYYAHGAFFRGHAVAPRIGSVPRPVRYGGAWQGASGPRGFGAPGYRATPAGPRAIGPAPHVSPGGAGRAAPMMAPRATPTPAPRMSPPSFSGPRGGGSVHFGGRGRR